jgi:carbamoylphosphate synthase large subunit
VVKRLDLSGSVGIEIATSRSHLADILRTPVFAGRPYLLQALVPGEHEYATFCVADRGRITWHWTFVSTMGGPAVVKTEDNDKNRRTIEAAPTVLQQIEAVLGPLAFHGPCIVNYKLRADGDIQIFEINPRFGGSLLQPAQAPQLRQAITALLHVER